MVAQASPTPNDPACHESAIFCDIPGINSTHVCLVAAMNNISGTRNRKNPMADGFLRNLSQYKMTFTKDTTPRITRKKSRGMSGDIVTSQNASDLLNDVTIARMLLAIYKQVSPDDQRKGD